jgi:tRNA A37 methylthiotransferase MiaB
MTGHVDERTRKARASELLSMSARARARFARAHVGQDATVLFESRLDDRRWVGHAEDHTLVAVAPDDAASLGNAIGRVTISGIDPDVPDRAVGRLIAVSRANRSLRRELSVLSPSMPGVAHAR